LCLHDGKSVSRVALDQNAGVAFVLFLELVVGVGGATLCRSSLQSPASTLPSSFFPLASADTVKLVPATVGILEALTIFFQISLQSTPAKLPLDRPAVA
jgi:hypothetical protein